MESENKIITIENLDESSSKNTSSRQSLQPEEPINIKVEKEDIIDELDKINDFYNAE